MATACDIRYCTADARFCVKEVDLAIVADMGTLQRLPGIVGQGERAAPTERVMCGAYCVMVCILGGAHSVVDRSAAQCGTWRR